MRSPKDLVSPLMVSTSSPRNSRSPKRTSIFRSLVGRSVVRMRSMRFSMDLTRLKVLSMPE